MKEGHWHPMHSDEGHVTITCTRIHMYMYMHEYVKGMILRVLVLLVVA